MLPPILHVISALGQPRIGSIYAETGTCASGYDDKGPYHCDDCIHKIAHDSPYCVHPEVVGDPELQDKLVMIDERPTVKIDLEHGCCSFVRPPAKPELKAKTSDSGGDRDDDEK